MSLNVSLFDWQTHTKRILTEDNLVCCVVISSGSLLFLGRCKMEENLNHLFMECIFTSRIWSSVLHWLGIFVLNCQMFTYNWWFASVSKGYSSLLSSDLVGFFIGHLEGA
jgi:hypothetical protein